MHSALLAACVLLGVLQGHAKGQAEAPGARAPEDDCEFLHTWAPASILSCALPGFCNLSMHKSWLSERLPCLSATLARQASETCALLFQGTSSASLDVTDFLLGTVSHAAFQHQRQWLSLPHPTSQQSLPKAAT